MTDQDYARSIRYAAQHLCEEIERAADTGLLIECKISPNGYRSDGGRITKQFKWCANVAIHRETWI